MKIVHIYETQDDASQTITCTVKLVGNQVKFTGQYGKYYKEDLQWIGVHGSTVNPLQRECCEGI